jgi:hypothetical protein
MAVVVIGGHSRNIGKTAVAAALIGALREKHWIAVKITQHGHEICSNNGKACHCAAEAHPCSVFEETDRSGQADTSRFLLAGAARALWVRTRQGQLPAALPVLIPLIEAHPFVIVESNSLVEFVKPALYLPVLKGDVLDFKPSARRALKKADAFIRIGTGECVAPWGRQLPRCIPSFPVSPPDYVSEPLLQFIRQRI